MIDHATDHETERDNLAGLSDDGIRFCFETAVDGALRQLEEADTNLEELVERSGNDDAERDLYALRAMVHAIRGLRNLYRPSQA